MAKIKNNKKVDKNAISKKGFTLVELLMTILIIGIIAALSTYGVISAVNSSKTTSKKITMSNLQEAAKTYSLEHDDSVWHSLSNNDYEYYCRESACPNFDNNYKYFCVTIQELINKGLLNKEKIEVNNINPNIYVMVKKHKMTSNVLNGTNNDDVTSTDYMNVGQYNLCTGSYVNEAIVKYPSLGEASSHTDDLIIGYEEGETQESDITEYTCSYGESSNDMSQEVKGNNKKCVMTSLKNNTNYYVKVCMKTDRGSIVCSDSKAYKTKDFISPEITKIDRRKVNIKYNDTNINVTGEVDAKESITPSKPSHYFMSTIKAITTTDIDIRKCQSVGGICLITKTRNIDPNTLYKVDGNEVNLEYLNQDAGTTVTVTTTIADGSNNNKQFKKDIVIEKDLVTYTATFHKGLADTINGGTSDVKISCQAEEGKSCTTSEVAPNITRGGYNELGWNTNQDAKTELFKSGTKVTLTGNVSYYPITYKPINVTFYKNGATSIGKASDSCNIYNSETICNIESPSITRNGFTILGWGSTSSSHTALAKVGETLKGVKGQIYYAITKRDITAKFDKNGATSISNTEENCEIWNTATSCNITSPSIEASANTPKVVGWNTNILATSSIWNAGTSKSFNYNPPTYYAITKSEKKICTIKFHIEDAAAIKLGPGISFPQEKSCTIEEAYNGKAPSKTCTIQAPFLTANDNYTVKGWGIMGDPSVANGGNIETNWVFDNYYSVTSELPKNTYVATFIIVDSQAATANSYTANCSASSGQNCTISAPTLQAIDGYKVYGWSNTRGSTKVDYISGGTITLSGNKTFYSVTSKALTIYFKGNGSKIFETPNKTNSKTLTCNGTNTECEATCTVYNGTYKCGITTPSFENKDGETHYFSLGESNRFDNYQKDTTDLYQAADGGISLSHDGNVYYAIALDGINNIRYKCYKDGNSTIGFADVYNITVCNANNCKYDSIQGIGISPVRELVRNGLRLENGISGCQASYYVSACSGLKCRKDASTSSQIETTFSAGTHLENIVRTPTAFDSSGTNWWYYVPASNCYVSGKYLSSSAPNCDSGGSPGDSTGGSSGGSSGGGSYVGYYDGSCTCSTNKDCVTSNKSIRTWCERGQCAWTPRNVTGGNFNLCW